MIEKYLINPFQKFTKIEGLGGILLFGATILAIAWANSPWGDTYQEIWKFKIGFSTDSFKLSKPVMLWINDALMAVFFFLIGLEIKRELVIGELNTPRKATFPLLAAIGGMSAPVVMYLLMNNNPESASGWGIPMATDIAFSLAILNLLGKRVPVSLKIFLTAFAIVDDIGAVLVIAVFYSEEIKIALLLIALVPILILAVLGRFRYYSKYLWISLGSIVWLLFLKAGIHPTIAGVLLAFTVPIRRKIRIDSFKVKLKEIVDQLKGCDEGEQVILSKEQINQIDDLEDWTEKVQSPLQHLEHKLHPWVAYFIMPLFALANAGVVFDFQSSIDTNIIFLITICLFLGNIIGIPLITMLGVKLKITELPDDIRFIHIIGVAFLAGVGFTMSIFISNLAFTDNLILTNSAKIGILAGSLLSGITGYLILRSAGRKMVK